MKLLIILAITTGIAFSLTVNDLPLKIIGIQPEIGVDIQLALRKEWKPNLKLSTTEAKYLTALLNKMLFNGEKPVTCAKSLKRFHSLIVKGILPDQGLELSENFNNTKISDEALITGAEALKFAAAENLPSDIYYEIIAHGFSEKWDSNMLLEGVKALKVARDRNIDLSKTAITVMIRFDQGLGSSSPSDAVQEEITALLKRTTEDILERTIKAGVASSIARDIYLTGLQEKWSKTELEAIMQGLATAQSQGISAEKAGLAMVVRMAKGLDGTPPERMVGEELKFVAALSDQKIRVEEIRKNPELKAQLKAPTFIARHKIVNGINETLLRESILSFYKAPTTYVWGGTKRGGADCSGFVQSCYLDQGIMLPRTSREMYRSITEADKIISADKGLFGDLIFFDTNGMGQVSHVGVIYGDGTFVHSCSSVGVTFTPLSNSYFKKRLLALRRVAG